MADSASWLGRLMLAPAIFYIFALVRLPFLLALWFYSFTDVTDQLASAVIRGLGQLPPRDRRSSFPARARQHLPLRVRSQILVLVLATILAIALQRDFRGKWLVRLLILLPWVAPVSLGSIGWLWMLDSIYSVINWTLRALDFSDRQAGRSGSASPTSPWLPSSASRSGARCRSPR